MLGVLARRLGSKRVIASRSMFSASKEGEPTVPIIFVDENGETKVNAKVGASLLDVAQEADLDVEGACEGTLACSTCHMILEQSLFDQLTEACEEEMDMLDLASGVEDTSRLGCQIHVTKEMTGTRIRLPSETVNQL